MKKIKIKKRVAQKKRCRQKIVWSSCYSAQNAVCSSCIYVILYIYMKILHTHPVVQYMYFIPYQGLNCPAVIKNSKFCQIVMCHASICCDETFSES